MKKEKVAVVLFSLGAPDQPKSVFPFLFNLFSDPAIIPKSYVIRKLLALLISLLRTKQAKINYSHLGGGSPLLENTLKQSNALMRSLTAKNTNYDFKTFVVMRYWHPFSKNVVKKINKWQADRIVMLPMYPQFSTTTTNSSFKQFNQHLKSNKFFIPQHFLCCYYKSDFFIEASRQLIIDHLKNENISLGSKNYKFIFSAHGLPVKFINAFGDPYQQQVEESVQLIANKLKIPKNNWLIAYQSRVGKLKWIEPYLDKSIEKLAKDNKLIIYPVSFVSEHSETLVELDIEYYHLAKKHGNISYIRIPTLSTSKIFIDGLSKLVLESLNGEPSAYIKHCSRERFGCFRNISK